MSQMAQTQVSKISKTRFSKLELNLEGNPAGMIAKSPTKETDECSQPELTGEMFCYNRKNTFIKRAKEEWNHDIEYDPESHDGLDVCIDLLYDCLGYGERYCRFDLVYDTKKSQDH